MEDQRMEIEEPRRKHFLNVTLDTPFHFACSLLER